MIHIKKPIVAVLTSAALALGVSAVLAAPAQATTATPGCVTHSEWKYKIHKGMTREQVYNATGAWGSFDTSFENSDGTIDRDYNYRECNRHGNPSSYTTWMEYSNYTYDRSYDIVWHRPPVLTYKGSWFGF